MALDFVPARGYPSPVLNPFTDLTVNQLKRAVAIKERIEELERELASVVGHDASTTTTRPGPRKRRKMSRAARAKIAAAARARWAKFRAAKAK
jgi:hypothetical protein